MGNPSGEIDRQYLDSTKIREGIGWQPKVDLREGLELTLEWYAAHPEVRPAAAGARLLRCGCFGRCARGSIDCPMRLSANSTARPAGRNGSRIPAALPPKPG